jgi:hypothetical protein
MIRVLLATSGALFLGSIGAFFLFVPMLSIATVVWILVGFILMFALGVQVGSPSPAFLTIRSHLTAFGYSPRPHVAHSTVLGIGPASALRNAVAINRTTEKKVNT